jgi:phosphoribosylamine--glycine ligase
MKLLLIGGGGREHALAWRLSADRRVTRIFAAPGNPGIAAHAECIPLSVEDIDGLLKFAKSQAIDLTVVGPEDPLAAGIVDRFTEAGLKIFGPTREAARLESDKAFAKELMRQYKIPTAEARIFECRPPSPDIREGDQSADAVAYIRSRKDIPVIKAAGLAKGKGVIVPHTQYEAVQAVQAIMDRRAFGAAGDKVVVEERLSGEEVSVLALTDGTTIYVLEPCQDHKAIFDGDKGPNTGGMGAYCPTPVMTDKLMEEIERTILVPAVHGMKSEGRPFKGVLYAGLMLTRSGPKVLEFNARFGDPEAQPLMLRLKSGLLDALLGVVNGKLGEVRLEWDRRPGLCVVMASKGYPGDYDKGRPIQGLASVDESDSLRVFHSGTSLKQGWVETAGGRVLSVAALGDTLADAQRRAYEAVRKIHFDGAQYRTDIGWRAIGAAGSASVRGK